VALNRGLRDGVERGHVLALWSAGSTRPDSTDPDHAMLQLPDERNGLLFVFRVFERVSYALILNTQDPVKPGTASASPDGIGCGCLPAHSPASAAVRMTAWTGCS
jgi:hypothetical protein